MTIDRETELTKEHLGQIYGGELWDLATAMFEGWELGQLKDLASHGADSGWPGLTYTRDCVALFDAHASTIWEMAVVMAEDMGDGNVAQMIGGFGRSDMVDDWDTFRNLMAWFAAEEIARTITDRADELEDEDDDD